MEILIYYLLTVNALGLVFMLADKRKAVKKGWRIPEAMLLGLGFFGGSLGCTLGMYLFRHKTRKPAFALGLPVMLILQIVLLIWLCANN